MRTTITSQYSAEDRPPGAALPAPKPALPGGPNGAGPLPPPPGAAGAGVVAPLPAPGLGRGAIVPRAARVKKIGSFAGSGADLRGISTAGAPLARIAAMTGSGGPGEESVLECAGSFSGSVDPAASTGAPAGAGAGAVGVDGNGCAAVGAALVGPAESGCVAVAAGAVVVL